jgi:hypothetical protein
MPEARYQSASARARRRPLGHPHGDTIEIDGSRQAVCENSIGEKMPAALTLMANDDGSMNIVYQQLLWLALDTDTNNAPTAPTCRTASCPTASIRIGDIS